MAIRAKDIAEMLGVSTAAVSLVVNGRPGVGEKTRQEILEKIRELGCEYLLKENVLPQKKGTIGFVVYKKSGLIIEESPLFTSILEGIERQVTAQGYTLNFIYMNASDSASDALPALPQAAPTSEAARAVAYRCEGCDGLLLYGVEMDRADLEPFLQAGIPFVVLDNAFPGTDVDSVAIDNALGVSQAIRFLADHGHERIGYLRCTERIAGFEERFTAYEQRMRELGLPVTPDRILDVGYSEEEISDAIDDYLNVRKVPERPTAFFADNDFIACHAMLAFRAHGLDCPDDLSLIGFDDRQICRMVTPQMSAVSIPKSEFGPAAVDLLLSRMGGRTYSVKLRLGTQLVARESVRVLYPFA